MTPHQVSGAQLNSDGNAHGLQRSSRRDTPPTPHQLKLIDAGARISAAPPAGDDIAFTHAVLCQVGMPRSQIAEREFRRQSGSAWLKLQAGSIDEGAGEVEQPLPYGPIPRLALAWVSTYAKRFATREIPIGETAAEFLRMLGMDDQGARYTRLRQQMHALVACSVQIGYQGETISFHAVERFRTWHAADGEKSRWPGVLWLSDGYYRTLADYAVPLDNRALQKLAGSALALDTYCWLAHRLHRIEGRQVTLHWKSLRGQFGQEYQGKEGDKDFKRKFIPALQAALTVYPEARVEQVFGGLRLMPSPPPVSVTPRSVANLPRERSA